MLVIAKRTGHLRVYAADGGEVCGPKFKLMTHSWESFVDEPCPVVLQTLNNRLQPPPNRLFDQARYQCFQEVALILLHLCTPSRKSQHALSRTRTRPFCKIAHFTSPLFRRLQNMRESLA
jgi:hypothetical protein